MFINAAWESLLGSKTSLNSKSGAVESGCAIDAETMKKWTNAKKMTTSDDNNGKRRRQMNESRRYLSVKSIIIRRNEKK